MVRNRNASSQFLIIRLFMTQNYSYLYTYMQTDKSITLCELLGIEFPVIMAPMFLVSNEKMILEALNSGITGAIPAFNYRSSD